MADSEPCLPKGVSARLLLLLQACPHKDGPMTPLRSHFFSRNRPQTHRKQLLTPAGLAQPQYAVHVDAGPGLVAVLDEAEGLKVEAGDGGDAVAGHGRALLHRASVGQRSVKAPEEPGDATRGVLPYPVKKLCCSVCDVLYAAGVAKQ